MEKINVIIDCDPGIDDTLALLMALLSEDVNVLGISICGGNNTVDKGYLNAKRVLHFLGKEVEVVKGLEKPCHRPLEITEETHGVDGFGEYAPAFDKAYGFDAAAHTPERSMEAFYEAVLNSGQEVQVLALGPMTNIAHLLERMPEAFGKVTRLVSMGGNYKSHGNCSPLAEFNYWVDPEAARFVYQHAPVPVEMVGLDVTRQILLEETRLQALIDINPKIGHFIQEITRFYKDFHWKYEGIRGCIINDPLAFALLIDEELLQGFEAYTDIACEGIARGVSVVDDHHFYKKPANAIIYNKVDAPRFFEKLQAIFGGAR